MKKIIPIVCCCILIICLFTFIPNSLASVEAKNNTKDIVGTWISHENTGSSNYYDYKILIQFKDDGTGLFYSEYSAYSNGTDIKDAVIDFTYKYDGDSSLTVNTKDGTGQFYCTVCGNGMISDLYELKTSIFERIS